MIHRPLTISSAAWAGGRPRPKNMMGAWPDCPPPRSANVYNYCLQTFRLDRISTVNTMPS